MLDSTNSSGIRDGNATDPPALHLGELLVEAKLITAEQLATAEAKRAETGEFLTKILVQSECLSQEDLSACFVKRCKIPHISLLDYDVGSDVLALVPQEVCLKHGLIPIDKLGRILTVAMVDPLDTEALDVVKNASPELRIKPILCNWAHFEQVTKKYFAAQNAGKGGGQMSAASLGLAALAPKPVAKAEEASPATPAPAPTSAPASSSSGAPAASPPSPAPSAAAPVDTGPLVAAIQSGFQHVSQSFLEQVRAQSAPAPIEMPPFPVEALTQALQSSLRDVVETTLKAVPAPAAAPEVAAPQAVSAPDFSGLETSFRAAIGDLKEALQSSMTTPAPAPAPEAAAPPAAVAPVVSAPDLSGLETSFRAAIGDLKEALQSAMTTAAPAAASTPGPPPAPAISPALEATLQQLSDSLSRESNELSGEAMAEVIRDSVGGAMQEALAGVIVQLRATAKAEEPSPPPFDAFAEMIRDTLGGIMQETLATMLIQSKANASQEGNGRLEEVIAALRESQSGIVHSMQSLLTSNQQSQEVQSARLAALAEAAVESSQQTTQLLEATLVQREREENLRGGRAPHDSVSPFGAPVPGAVPDAALEEDDARVRDALESEVPLETLTFSTFFPGDANAFTAKICQAVAAKPGSEYNPLFLYGHVGLGKTHLISAVGNHIKQANPQQRVGYVSASHFARRLKEAVAADAQMAFRDNYCHWDVLILDDIQFMGGRVEAQEEFFHIFNVLHQRGRQIIIAGDKAPDRLGLLEQRLVSRFASGIVAELKPPEWETRMKILRQQLKTSGVTLPEEICSLVAMRVSDDIRKMVGSLRKIAAFASLSNEPISVEMATEILSHIGGEEAA